MSQFPLDTSSNLVEAVNYLLSGPTSSGQNFEGVSYVTPFDSETYFTGTQIAPQTEYGTYSWPAWSAIPIAQITATISNIVPVIPTGTDIVVTLTTPVANVGFFVGRKISLASVNPSGFDGIYTLDSWTLSGTDVDTITLTAAASTTWPAYISGGTVDGDGLLYYILSITPDSALTNKLVIECLVPFYPNPGLAGLPDDTNAPFSIGQVLNLVGTNPADYEGQYKLIDVSYDYTPVFADQFYTATITVLSWTTQTWPAWVADGYVNWNYNWQPMPTDCNAIVTVTGPTDRVFVSSQSTNVFYWYATTPTQYSPLPDLPSINVKINRWKAVGKTTLPNGPTNIPYDTSVPTNQSLPNARARDGYLWQYDTTILSIPFDPQPVTAVGAHLIDLGLNIFVNIIDSPSIGYYWYILEFQPEGTVAGLLDPLVDAYPLTVKTSGLRSFTAQVIKQ